MPAQLPPEVYRLIIKYLISSEGDTSDSLGVQQEHAQTFGLPATVIRRGNQASLANLMRVSKVSSIVPHWANVQKLYEICETELYKDCLVADIETLAQDIGTNPRKVEHLALIKTLRVYLGNDRSLEEPTYTHLIVDGEWTLSGSVSTSEDCFLGMWLALDHPTFARRFLLFPAAEAVQKAVDSRFRSQGAFAALERVIMTREAESFPWGVLQLEFYNFNNVLDPPPVPLLLANLPSVKHYCQFSPVGPLALPNQTLQIEHPPEVVTIHRPGLYSDLGPAWRPPIVFGSTNRLMCNGTNVCLSNDAPGATVPIENIARFLAPLEEMLGEITVLRAGVNQHTLISSSSVPLENTKIEIYDYIRHFTFSGAADIQTADSRPTDLSQIQAILDARIGRWKGKVFLKNREDWPLCSACGFEGFWKYK